MIIKKGFFNVKKFEISDGKLQERQYKWFGIKHLKDNDSSVELNDIDYIDKVKYKHNFNPFGRWCVEFVASNGSIFVPKITDSIADKFIQTAKNGGVSQKEHKYCFVPSKMAMMRHYKGTVLITEENDRIVQKVYNKNLRRDSVALNEVLYFDELKSKGFKGIAFGTVAGGGVANTVELFGLSKDEYDRIYKMIIKSGSKVSQSGIQIFKSKFPLFTPTRWFRRREYLSIADFGIMHKQYNVKINKRKFSTRTTVLPFDGIKGYSHSGFIFKRMEILGDTSILTQEAYGLSAKREIWKEFKKRKIANNYGDVFKAQLWHRRENGYIIATNEYLIWKLKKETRTLRYENVYSCKFEKENWFSFSGKIEIKGRRVDARAGEGGDIKMEINNLGSRKGKRLKRLVESRRYYNS